MKTIIWLIIIIGLILALPTISRRVSGFVRQWIARAVERRIRRMMGIPPEPEKNRRSSARSARQNHTEETRGRQAGHGQHEPLIPKEYAVDVEYTEIREYSSRTEIHPDPDGVRVVTESQVTDAEYVVIRPESAPATDRPEDNGKGSKKRFWK